ncbi:hypothetical protein HDU96_008942 [Phlyctochytrium bullatum]|nr:hypothetical protein HDU96_008942 [Phlyctochytrium bullatum]
MSSAAETLSLTSETRTSATPTFTSGSTINTSLTPDPASEASTSDGPLVGKTVLPLTSSTSTFPTDRDPTSSITPASTTAIASPSTAIVPPSFSPTTTTATDDTIAIAPPLPPPSPSTQSTSTDPATASNKIPLPLAIGIPVALIIVAAAVWIIFSTWWRRRKCNSKLTNHSPNGPTIEDGVWGSELGLDDPKSGPHHGHGGSTLTSLHARASPDPDRNPSPFYPPRPGFTPSLNGHSSTMSSRRSDTSSVDVEVWRTQTIPTNSSYQRGSVSGDRDAYANFDAVSVSSKGPAAYAGDFVAVTVDPSGYVTPGSAAVLSDRLEDPAYRTFPPSITVLMTAQPSDVDTAQSSPPSPRRQPGLPGSDDATATDRGNTSLRRKRAVTPRRGSPTATDDQADPTAPPTNPPADPARRPTTPTATDDLARGRPAIRSAPSAIATPSDTRGMIARQAAGGNSRPPRSSSRAARGSPGHRPSMAAVMSSSPLRNVEVVELGAGDDEAEVEKVGSGSPDHSAPASMDAPLSKAIGAARELRSPELKELVGRGVGADGASSGTMPYNPFAAAPLSETPTVPTPTTPSLDRPPSHLRTTPQPNIRTRSPTTKPHIARAEPASTIVPTPSGLGIPRKPSLPVLPPPRTDSVSPTTVFAATPTSSPPPRRGASLDLGRADAASPASSDDASAPTLRGRSTTPQIHADDVKPSIVPTSVVPKPAVATFDMGCQTPLPRSLSRSSSRAAVGRKMSVEGGLEGKRVEATEAAVVDAYPMRGGAFDDEVGRPAWVAVALSEDALTMERDAFPGVTKQGLGRELLVSNDTLQDAEAKAKTSSTVSPPTEVGGSTVVSSAGRTSLDTEPRTSSDVGGSTLVNSPPTSPTFIAQAPPKSALMAELKPHLDHSVRTVLRLSQSSVGDGNESVRSDAGVVGRDDSEEEPEETEDIESIRLFSPVPNLVLGGFLVSSHADVDRSARTQSVVSKVPSVTSSVASSASGSRNRSYGVAGSMSSAAARRWTSSSESSSSHHQSSIWLTASEGSPDPSASRTDSAPLLLRPHHVATPPAAQATNLVVPHSNQYRRVSTVSSHLHRQPSSGSSSRRSSLGSLSLVVGRASTVRSSVTGSDDGGAAPPRKRRRSVPSVASSVDSMRTFEWYAQLELDAIGSGPLDAPAGQGEQEEEFFVPPESPESWDRYERYPVPPPHLTEAMRVVVGMGSRFREENDEEEQPNHSTLSSDMTLRGADLGMQVHGRPPSFDEGFHDAREPSLAPSSAHVAPRRHDAETVSYYSAERWYPARAGSPSRTSEYPAAELNGEVRQVRLSWPSEYASLEEQMPSEEASMSYHQASSHFGDNQSRYSIDGRASMSEMSLQPYGAASSQLAFADHASSSHAFHAVPNSRRNTWLSVHSSQTPHPHDPAAPQSFGQLRPRTSTASLNSTDQAPSHRRPLRPKTSEASLWSSVAATAKSSDKRLSISTRRSSISHSSVAGRRVSASTRRSSVVLDDTAAAPPPPRFSLTSVLFGHRDDNASRLRGKPLDPVPVTVPAPIEPPAKLTVSSTASAAPSVHLVEAARRLSVDGKVFATGLLGRAYDHQLAVGDEEVAEEAVGDVRELVFPFGEEEQDGLSSWPPPGVSLDPDAFIMADFNVGK